MLSSFLFRKQTKIKTDHAAAGTNCTAMTSSDPPLGLKTIAAGASLDDGPARMPNCVKRALVVAAAAAPASSPTSAFSSSIEGCVVHEEEEEVAEEGEEGCWATYGSRRGRCRWRRFPPPIPLLARTGNLAGHMPWVLQRIYGDDGRLQIREIRVRHHEYFRAQRANGRLVLQLIELDDGDRRSDDEKEFVEELRDDAPSSLVAPSWPPPPPEKEETQEEREKKTPSPWLVKVAMSTSTAAAMVPASLPETTCGKERCDLDAGSRTLHRQLPVSRARMVHG